MFVQNDFHYISTEQTNQKGSSLIPTMHLERLYSVFFCCFEGKATHTFFFLPESGLCKGQFIINTMVNTNSRTYCKRCLNTQLEVLFHWPCFYMCHCITYNVRSSHFASLLFFPSHTVQLIYPCTTPPP